MGIFIFWIIFSFVVGFIGSGRRIGFFGAFFLSLLLSPIIGLVFALISKNKEDELYKKQLLEALQNQNNNGRSEEFSEAYSSTHYDSNNFSKNRRKRPYSKKNTAIVISVIFIPIIILGIFANNEPESKNSQKEKTVIDDKRSYDKPWRNPRGSEYGEIGSLMVENNIKVCGEYYIKEIEEKEYVIACTPDGEKWIYYVAWTGTGSIYLANDKMEARLSPPN